MATPRLILGAGATQLIISEVGSGSSYGGSARTDVTLFVQPGWGRIDAGRQTTVVFGVHIDSSSEATFKSRYEELISVLENPQRDVVFEWDTGSEHLAMRVTTRDYVSVSAQANSGGDLPYSTVAAMIAVTFIGERRVLGVGIGSAGTIENPTGLQTAIRWEATYGPLGTLAELVATGTFVGSSSVEAQARAGTWRDTWSSTLPNWLDAATTLKEMEAKFEFDTSDTECVCTLRFAQEEPDAPDVASAAVWRYSATLAPHTLGHRSGDEAGPPGGDGKILTVDGELTLRGAEQGDFGGPTTAPAGGEEALTTQVLLLIDHAKRKASATGAKTLSPLSLTITNGGWRAAFSYAAIIDTDLISWTESVIRPKSSAATVLPASDGGVRVYRPASGDIARVRVQWSCVALVGASIPAPYEPPGLFLITEDTPADPAYSSTRGHGDDDVGRVRTIAVSGSREYLLLPAAQ